MAKKTATKNIGSRPAATQANVSEVKAELIPTTEIVKGNQESPDRETPAPTKPVLNIKRIGDECSVLGNTLMHLLTIENSISLLCSKYEKGVDPMRGVSVISGALQKFQTYNEMHTALINKIEEIIAEDVWLKDFLNS